MVMQACRGGSTLDCRDGCTAAAAAAAASPPPLQRAYTNFKSFVVLKKVAQCLCGVQCQCG